MINVNENAICSSARFSNCWSWCRLRVYDCGVEEAYNRPGAFETLIAAQCVTLQIYVSSNLHQSLESICLVICEAIVAGIDDAILRARGCKAWTIKDSARAVFTVVHLYSALVSTGLDCKARVFTNPKTPGIVFIAVFLTTKRPVCGRRLHDEIGLQWDMRSLKTTCLCCGFTGLKAMSALDRQSRSE